jgi:transcription termination factor NusB
MTKFFIQLLLSIMLGVGAAVGFSPDIREKVHETWDEATTFVHETAQAAFETIAGVEIKPEASAETSVETDIDTEVSAEAEIEAEAELEAELEAEVEAELEELENEIESGVDLGLDFDK